LSRQNEQQNAGFFWNGNENETVTLSLQRCRFLCSPAAAAAAAVAICGVIHVMGSELGGDRVNCVINIAAHHGAL